MMPENVYLSRIGQDATEPKKAMSAYSYAVESQIMITFSLNGNQVTLDVPDDMPVLWVLRDHLA